ncbi:peptidyl-prolyl cis-trans isomerase CYP63-like isoform X1 [Asparagus officinalis]|uniref:peptidyl-prolyl cis-trans isomerase CYP63-like isoform X1 n=1 Tax=Asparagus officinalis TaxID=4686 RepID=UPI00098E08C3|nr:peptidyl-prolyl cis-trans isomerase CYP63-like isoform X1 [Asparagus officinalis]
MDSAEEAGEGIKEENGSPPVESIGLNLFRNKDTQMDENFEHGGDVPNNGMQGFSDHEYPSSPVMHADVINEAVQSPIIDPNSAAISPAKYPEESLLPIESNENRDDAERSFDYPAGERRFSVQDYQSNDKKEGAEDAYHIAHSEDFVDSNLNETYDNEFHTEDSYSLVHNSLLTGDDNSYVVRSDEALNHHQIAISPALDEATDGVVGNASAKFHSENPEVHAKMDGGNLSAHNEPKEDDYSSIMAASENGGMVWENSSLHSPPRPQNASPSPERQFSISAERSTHSQQSPHAHPSLSQERVSSPANIDNLPVPSPSSSRRKRSPSLEKDSGGRKRPSSRDRSSSKRQKSPSERTTRRDSCRRDGSPRRHGVPSPQKRDSPRRRGRSRSRSPVRRRDSPARRRDHSRRSRSRSPYAKDRYRRSPRRRPSPRRRSPPPSHSHRRSPRRPWAPPANRNTGLGKPGNSLFVAGFSYVTTERDLEKKFSRFGRVTDVRIVRDKRSGESRGFGFLSLERDEDADAAIRAVDQTEWNGRIVLVEKSKTSTR